MDLRSWVVADHATALQRLERQGFIAADWGVSDTNRRARFYRLTTAGRKQLKQEHAEWRAFSAGIARIMGAEPEGQT